MSKTNLKKIIEYFLIVLCLTPLFFINVRASHEWGDDFALYVKQAKNINAGISQNETGYIFNEKCFIAPQAYPVGFPLLLSLVTQNMQGLNYQTFDLYMSLFLALTCLVGFLILRQYVSFITALATSLIIAYNPLLLHFKSEIASDLPFAFFSMLSVYLMLQKQNYITSILIGLLIGFSIHVRSVGFVLIPVFVIHNFFIEVHIKHFTFKKHLYAIIAIVVSLFTYFIIKISFPADTSYVYWKTSDFWKNINGHLSYNFHWLAQMFRDYKWNDYYFIGVIASSCLVIFSVLGFVYFFNKNKRSVINLYFLVYVFAIISYQYGEAGLRFLYPVLFFIFLYAIIGFKHSIADLNVNKNVVVLIICVLVSISYKDEIFLIKESENDLINGPEISEAKSVFRYINDSIPQKTVIAFPLPKVLILYTHVKSVTLNCANSDEEILSDVKKFKVKYILNSDGLSAEPIKKITWQDTALFKSIFSNNRFTLYRVQNEKL